MDKYQNFRVFLNKQPVSFLKLLLRQAEISGYSKLKKQQLINVILQNI